MVYNYPLSDDDVVRDKVSSTNSHNPPRPEIQIRGVAKQIKSKSKKARNNDTSPYNLPSDNTVSTMVSVKEELELIIVRECRSDHELKMLERAWLQEIVKPLLSYLHRHNVKPTTKTQRDAYLYSRFLTLKECTANVPTLFSRLTKKLAKNDTWTSPLHNPIKD
ncbi:uncharacterized protein EV154DRAFT_566752 [Mucor mucedo]|uniref:uncharacterized protein n=1 Tax=Mucor mucedo TaxID=29922 RepID=UPI00221F14D2|nr:uncharacterized protein EV154DRAFT_566752 [Mucor mucedo]KAI7888063.1 hypothetical protein EV154DRAFT_566752 [Mucor mucedo]